MIKGKQRNLFILDFETTGILADKNVEHYPIELGCVITTPDLEIIGEIDTMIRWDELREETDWLDVYAEAAKVHNILFSDYLTETNDNKTCKSYIVDQLINMTKVKPSKYPPVLVSNNAVFEYHFINKLFSRVDKNIYDYFHYSVWDTAMLMNTCDKIPRRIPAHRAINDAKQLYDDLVIVYNENNMVTK